MIETTGRFSLRWAYTVKLQMISPPFLVWFIGSLVAVMCNYILCPSASVATSHCGDNLENTLFLRLDMYYVHLVSAIFEHCVCYGYLMTTCITLKSETTQKWPSWTSDHFIKHNHKTTTG